MTSQVWIFVLREKNKNPKPKKKPPWKRTKSRYRRCGVILVLKWFCDKKEFVWRIGSSYNWCFISIPTYVEISIEELFTFVYGCLFEYVCKNRYDVIISIGFLSLLGWQVVDYLSTCFTPCRYVTLWWSFIFTWWLCTVLKCDSLFSVIVVFHCVSEIMTY